MELIKTLEDTADSAIACGRYNIQVRVEHILAIAETFRVLEKEQCSGVLLEREQHHVEVVGGLLKHIEELERERDAFRSNYSDEYDLRKQVEKNWDRLAAASGWVDSRDQNAVNNDLPRQFDSAVEMAASWKERAEAAEAKWYEWKDQAVKAQREITLVMVKLAELEKQRAVGTVSIAMDWNTHCNIATVNMRPDLVVAEMRDGDELFTRPAPAVSLAELVPDGWKLVPVEPNWEMLSADGCKEHHNGQPCSHHDNRRRIWSAMLAAAPSPSGDL